MTRINNENEERLKIGEALTICGSVEAQRNYLLELAVGYTQAIQTLRDRAEELRRSICTMPEIQSKMLTVAEAQMLNCCRLCKCCPVRVPTTLNYGEEYACSVCVEEMATMKLPPTQIEQDKHHWLDFVAYLVKYHLSQLKSDAPTDAIKTRCMWHMWCAAIKAKEQT